MIGASRIAVSAILEPARALPGIDVRAIAARDPARAGAFARKHAIENVHASYDALIDDPQVDLVYIATPPSHHAEVAIRALRAGKSVLVEKPFAMSAGEACAILAAAAASRTQAFEAMHSLHHPLFRRLGEMLAEWELGEVRHVRATFATPIAEDPADFRWHRALGGGALMDLGIYPLAWCRRMFGEAFTVTRASATWRAGVDIAFAASLRFAAGAEAEIRSSMVTPQHRASLEIDCEHGRVAIDNPLVPHLGHRVTCLARGGRSEIVVPGPTTYAAQLAAIRATIVDGAPFPLAADDPLCSMQAIDRVRAAIISPCARRRISP
ncbi:Gfo/Idh/MocA family oxidoreductase [Sphingomonas sp.]|uniref:Gfo/Idh/MocA family protein n=1 Tax=Sphingomonas sp. TaxID=28214 RepID=UPI001B24A86C|nr:Gfo/Idh/MocA family oxidoreductase [Sphingomonas sp.]MBO9711726.1 Gfo/Idh/MocA family oxidoreductase [Sphingomonas sp.]